jgi:hypothetical protein
VARWLYRGALIHPSAKYVRLICDFHSLCNFSGGNFHVYGCFGARVAAVVIFYSRTTRRTQCVQVRSRSSPRHSLTTVVESPNEVGSMKKEVWSDARNNRSAAIPAPCTGAICNFLLPTSTFILSTSMQGVAPCMEWREGWDFGVGIGYDVIK